MKTFPFHKHKLAYILFLGFVSSLLTGCVALIYYPLESLLIAGLYMVGVCGLLLMYRVAVTPMPLKKAWLHLVVGTFCILWAWGILEMLFWATLGIITGPIGS